MRLSIICALACSMFFLPVVCSSAESLEDWKPYQDYLRLPDKYKSPAMEKMYRDSYEAQLKVRKLPSTSGITVDDYLAKKSKTPSLEDLGWSTTPYQGGYNVERKMLLNKTMQIIYIWRVDSDGQVTPANGKAIGITAPKK